MSRDIAPFGIRMPQRLKTQLEKKAKENKRSMNSELVARLEESLKQEESLTLNSETVRNEELLTASGLSHEVLREYADKIMENMGQSLTSTLEYEIRRLMRERTEKNGKSS